MCAFFRYWAGLQEEKDRQILLEGAERLQRGSTSAHDATKETSIQMTRMRRKKLMSWEANRSGELDVRVAKNKKLVEKLS
jgi:hypothetical protein